MCTEPPCTTMRHHAPLCTKARQPGHERALQAMSHLHKVKELRNADALQPASHGAGVEMHVGLQVGASCAQEEAQKSLRTTKAQIGSLKPLVGSALKAAAWQLVYCEVCCPTTLLVVQRVVQVRVLLASCVIRSSVQVVLLTYITSALFWILPFMPEEHRTRHTKRNWRRALVCWGGLVNFRLLLKMLPFLGCQVDMQAQDPRFVTSLQEVSLLYRMFMYHL